VLKWGREYGCPWDGRTREHAAESGHTDLLRWAEENGCPPPAADEPLEEDAEGEDDAGSDLD
jgi:hypothetical protein